MNCWVGIRRPNITNMLNRAPTRVFLLEWSDSYWNEQYPEAHSLGGATPQTPRCPSASGMLRAGAVGQQIEDFQRSKEAKQKQTKQRSKAKQSILEVAPSKGTWGDGLKWIPLENLICMSPEKIAAIDSHKGFLYPNRTVDGFLASQVSRDQIWIYTHIYIYIYICPS